MDHQKDYSEYELTPFDKYQIRRKRRKDIILNYFHNKVRFDPENRMIRVFVDDEHEDYSMEDIYKRGLILFCLRNLFWTTPHVVPSRGKSIIFVVLGPIFA